MTERFHPYLGVLLAGCLLGCTTGSGSMRSDSRGSAALHSNRSAAAIAKRNEAEYERNVAAYSHYAAGLSFDLNNQPDLAIEEYWRSLQSDPSDEELALEVARRLMRSQEVDRAIEVLNLAAKQPDASGAVHAWLGLAYSQAGQKEKAIESNRAAIKKVPTVLPAYQNLAQLYLEQGKTNQAVKALDEAAAQRSVGAEFLTDLAELYFRLSRAAPSDADALRQKSGRVLDRAAELDPDNPAVQQKLADGYFQLGELTKAEPIYLELLERYPQLLIVRAKLAELYLRTDRNDKATAQLEQIANVDPTNPRTHSFLGALALEENKLPEAAEYFERALMLNPELEPLYYELAGINLNLRKPKEALELLDKARSKFKLNFIVEFYSGIAHVMTKNYADAVRYLTSAEVLGKAEAPERLNADFYFQLGAAYERNGDIAGAERAFRRCLELEPENPEALNYLGYMWAEKEMNLHEARQMIEKAVAAEPENAAFLDSLGWVLFKLGKPDQALDYILKAIKLSEEPDPTLYDHLGDIYLALKQTDRARDAWQKALEVEPNDAIQKKLEASNAAK